MVTLHILKWLEQNNIGTVDTDLFYEEAPLDSKGIPRNGLWIVTRGATISRFGATIQDFDIYSRYTDKLTGSRKLTQVLELLQEAYGTVCDLQAVPPYTTDTLVNVRLEPTSSIENVGLDSNNKIVRVISGTVQYDK